MLQQTSSLPQTLSAWNIQQTSKGPVQLMEAAGVCAIRFNLFLFSLFLAGRRKSCKRSQLMTLLKAAGIVTW